MEREANNVRQEARDWLLRMSSGLAGEADHAALRQWLGASQAHQQAFADLCHLWGELDLAREAMLDESRVRRPHRPQHWALAASLLLALVLWGGYRLYPGSGTNVSEPVFYSTDRGQTREISLADGSAVTLGAHSRLRVSFSPAARQLALLRGEGFFEVAHDRERPFRVSAAGVTTTALGTAFNVNLGSDRVTVVVAEGRVEIHNAQGSHRQQLEAGEASGYREDGTALAPRTLPAPRAAEWRVGRREYYQTPLRELVHDLNRYSKEQILLTSRRLGDTEITASFDNFAAVEPVLQAVENALPAEVVRTASAIHIRAR